MLVEGNYFEQGDYFFPIFQESSNKLFAPLDSNISSANPLCMSVFGRNCEPNYDTNAPENFILNTATLSDIGSSPSATTAIKSVKSTVYSSVPDHATGPQANITY